jgi:exopolysaccharide biosynthesis polyprenyl glycosylphosphotransferase
MTVIEESAVEVLEVPAQKVAREKPVDADASFRTYNHPAGATGERFRRTLALISCGHVSATALSMVALAFISVLFSPPVSRLWEAMICLVAIRLAYVLTRGPEPVLRRFLIRKTVRRVLVDEAKIAVGFLAAAFLLRWPTSLIEIVTYVAANIALQLGLLGYSRSVLKILADGSHRHSSSAACSRTAIIVGSGKQAISIADMLLSSPDLDTHVLGFLDYHRVGLWRYRDIPLIGHPDMLARIISAGQVDAVLIAVDTCDLPNARAILETAEQMGVNSYLLSDIYAPNVAVLRPEFLNGTPALVWRHVKENRAALFIKQTFDRLGALIGLVITSPVILFTAIAIKLDSAGPVFFAQVRCGLNGRPFNLYKFRTMTIDAEKHKDDLWSQNEMSGPVFKLKHDPRVTRVGKFLRKFSIDELPQLVNVMTGDMSLVGPRPPLPREVLKFEPWQHRKLSVRPGLTCIWQVSGRNRIGFEDWMRMDLEYIDRWSLLLDAEILARTIPTVLKGSGM